VEDVAVCTDRLHLLEDDVLPRYGEGVCTRTSGVVERRIAALDAGKQPLQQQGVPQNVGSQRALSFAEKSDLYDRALWTRTAAVTNAGGASTALVGSAETVAAAILDYVDAGADLVSIRGYDTLADAVDYGEHVLPLVRQEIAHREATGRRGTLQAEHLGNYAEDYRRHATAGRA
jgi:alkanesulfonate monooxygenase